jgi:hypothetical protein
MKTVFTLFLVFFGVSTTLLAQTTKTWDGGASTTNWSDGNNWNPNGAPAPTDIVSFTSNLTIIINTSNKSIGKLQVSNNATVTLQAESGASRTITVNTAASDAILVSQGSTLNIIGNDESGSNDRTLTLTTANTVNLKATINGTLKVSIDNGDSDAFGSFTKGGLNAEIIFASGSVYEHNVNGGTVPTATWDSISLCLITGITKNDPNGLDGQVFGNLTYNSTLQEDDETIQQSFTVKNDFKILSTGSASLRLTNSGEGESITTKNFIMEGGILNLSDNDGIGTLNISGNFSHTSGTITESNQSADTGSGSIVFTGNSNSTPQIFTSGGSVTNTINYTVNSGAILQMDDASTVVNGSSFTLSSGGTLDIKSEKGITTSATGTGATAGNIRTTTRTFSNAARYIYSGGSQSVGNGLLGARSLILSGSGTKTFVAANFTTNNLNVADTFRIESNVKATLPAGTNIATVRFIMGGIGQNFGQYGSTRSPAANKNNTFFTDAVPPATTGTVTANLSALPVTLSNFTAKPTTDNKVALAWVTSTEQVNKGFSIERQEEGSGKFQSLRFIASKAVGGNSQTTLAYSFKDVTAKNGTNMYRLVQEDLDGTKTYSEVRVVKLNGQSVSMVFPNPSNGAVNISRTADGRKMNIQVIDQSGRIVGQVNNITDANYRMNISQSGVYSIKMMYPETGEQSIQRVVVQK